MALNRVSDKHIIEAMYKTSGILNLTASYITKTYGIKISRQAVWKRVNASPILKAEQEKARELIKDGAEAVIVQEIGRGNWRVALQVLKTLAKDRGYAERQEITGANGEALPALDPKLIEIEFVKPALQNGDKS